MKKYVSMLAVLGIAGVCAAPASADPQSDLKQFQGYFLQKFKDVKPDEYSNGLYALPQFKDYRTMWESYNEFPPYEIGVDKGKKLWETKFGNGESFGSCLKKGQIKAAYTYPRWDSASKSLRVAEMDILDCAKSNGADPKVFTFLEADLNKDTKQRVQLAELTAYYYSTYRGKRVKPDVDFSNPDAVAAYERGKKFWWTRRGQLNFSCSNCHLDMAGMNIANQPLSAGLGHPLGWPAERLPWQRMETIMERYATCNTQVRAASFKHYSDEYLTLQLYETYMSSGLPLTAPSMRN
jgi:sulfur-oxidizing protein SoxA